MALPTNLFDESWYLARNPDVAAAIEAGLISSALDHFNLYGKFENRAAGPLFNPSDYLAANPDVAEAVQAGLISAYDHFMQYGASESRSPLSLFDPEFYLAQNPDVAAAVEAGLITATEHFLLYGQGEPRQINPFINLGDYMNANADIAEAAANGAISPLTHLLTHGAAEGRDLGNGINLGIFANDPKFQEAVQSGNLQAALERVEEVAPFLPTFEPPAGWEPPADTPIPTDFTPPEGTKLVIPPSVNVPDDVELPDDIFEPVEPGPGPEPQPEPEPTPPAPPGDSDGGGANPLPTVRLTDDDAADGTLIAKFSKGVTNGVIDLNAISPNQFVVVDGEDLTTLTVKGSLSGEGAFYLDVGDKADHTSEPAALGTAAKLQTLNLSMTGEPVTVWQWGTNALDIESVSARGSKTSINATIHAEVGGVSLKNLTGGSKNDELNIDPHAFGADLVKINLGEGDDILSFDATLPTSATINFDHKHPSASFDINGGAGNDEIHITTGTIATGGRGDDTFVVRSDAGTGKPTHQIVITDYGTGKDVIDLTRVSGLQLQGPKNDRLEIHQGGKTGEGWGNSPQGTQKDLLIQLSGGAGTQLILEGAYAAKTTVALQITEPQAGTFALTNALVNIADGGTIDARGYENGVILSGGSGKQTLISSGHNDVMQGGADEDIFVITATAGPLQPTQQIYIADYGNGNDTIDLTSVANLKLGGSSGDRLEVHQGGKTGGSWGDKPQGTADDLLIQLSGGSGTQLILHEIYNKGATVALKVTEQQAGLSTSTTVKDFLVNITHDGEVDATPYNHGAILSGGSGSQTLVSGKGNDIMQGGEGDDLFVFNGDFGVDVILDYGRGADKVQVEREVTLNTELKTLAQLSGEIYGDIGLQLRSFLDDEEGTTAISVFEHSESGNALILLGEVVELATV